MKEARIVKAANTKRNPEFKPPVVIKLEVAVNEIPEGQTAEMLYTQIDQEMFEYLINRELDAKLTSTLFVKKE